MAEFEPKQFGKYYLLEKLAVGGMAEIYKAKTFGVDGFEKQLALKRILPHCSADKDFITMLTDEAKLSVLLSHANIVQVYDLGKVGDDYFISMEYINGPNLRDIIYRCREKNTPFPTELAVYIASEICKGLDYAHRKTDQNNRPLNIVHRDVSPQNILISYEGEVKIVDFGIAKAAMNISHTMAGILKGKIAYMSPEQALGKTVDSKSDIFSTGILLFEMLTQEKLFTGESQFEVLKKIRTTKVVEETLPKSIPDDLKKILAKALAYFPKDRYANAGLMQMDLTRYLYQKYVDFTPQKLASFVQELFSDELKRQQALAAREMALEAQTSSMNVAEEAMQENIVHREDTGITLKDHEMGTGIGTGYLKTPEAVRSWRRRTIKKIATIVFTVGIAAIAGFAYWKFIHPIILMPAATTGTLSIISEPPGAKIFLDGKETGFSTPAILDDLALGKEYSIKLRKEGFADQAKSFVLNDTEPHTYKFELKKAMGTLEISSAPAGAKIIIDNEDTGKVTPATISNLELGKDTKVSVALAGFREKEQKLKLETEEPQKLDFELEKIVYGSIRITSTPAGAGITINGRGTGNVTPTVITGLEQGRTYRILAAKSGYESESRVINLDKDEVSITFTLKKEAEAATTTLSVGSDPAGASIILNGRATGKRTPAVLPNLEVGKTYRVGLSLDGYKSATERITIASKEPQSFSKTLTKEEVTTPATTTTTTTTTATTTPTTGGFGSISVKSNPTGADVYINAELRGKTPTTIKNVPSGSALVMVSKKGYQSKSITIALAPGETKEVSFTMVEGVGEVTIITTPPAADVVFNGQPIARTPVTVRNVRIGESHSVTVSLPGYKTWSFNFEMDKKVKSFNKNLEKE